MYFNAKDFDYNIENLLNDYYKYVKESKSYKFENRDEFIYADSIKRNLSDYEAVITQVGDELNNNQNQNQNQNTSPDNNMANNEFNYINENEIELMRALYTEINRTLLPYVIEVLDTFEYSGSPVYAEDGITREFLAQVVDRVLNRAAQENDGADEVFSENSEQTFFTPWSRWMLMRATAEAIILSEIFGVRRK